MNTRTQTIPSRDETPENYRSPGKSDNAKDISPSAREMLGVLGTLNRNMF